MIRTSLEELKEKAAAAVELKLGSASIHNDANWDRNLRSMYASMRFHEEVITNLIPVAKESRDKGKANVPLEVFLHVLIWSLQFENLFTAAVRHDEGAGFFSGVLATHIYEMCQEQIGQLTNEFRRSPDFNSTLNETQRDEFDAAKRSLSAFTKKNGAWLKEIRVSEFAHRDNDVVALWDRYRQRSWKKTIQLSWEYYQALSQLIGSLGPAIRV